MKYFRLIIVMAGFMLLSSCDFDSVVPESELPPAAKAYIEQNQPDTKVLLIKKERSLFKTRYNVTLDNRMEIEFNGDGLPVDLDMDD
ncbi:MAG: PepSY-like domain-containing protein [Prevotella sp.]|nr:PepSY-like domain-containing protein [Prevotella sp.]